MAGHSKWANIKHKKARVDAQRGRIWSKCSRAIMVAARQGGGDPETNVALRDAVEEAKSHNMPKDKIETAIKKGTGELAAASYERVMYEGYGPSGVAVLVDALTDNRHRTAPEIKKIFDRHNGSLGTSGCVAYLFHTRGEVFLPRDAADEETLMDATLDAGAEEIADNGDAWQILCDPRQLTPVREALEAAEIPFDQATVTMVPEQTIPCSGEDARKTLAMIEALEDHDDVQKVHANFEIPDEEMAALQQ